MSASNSSGATANGAAHRRNRTIASPRARRSLLQRGIDASTLRGSGPDGRIIEADVLKYAKNAPALSGALASSLNSQTPSARPTIQLRAELDASRLVELHEKFAPRVAKSHGTSLSLTDFMLKALATALLACPDANRIGQDGNFVPAPAATVGLDVDGSTRIFPDAASLNLIELARLRRDSGAIVGSGQGSAAVVLFNAGRGRIDEWTAEIPPNAAAVLAVGSICPRPYASDKGLVICPTLRLNLSVDSTAYPPRQAAQLFEAIIEFLEEPESLIFG